MQGNQSNEINSYVRLCMYLSYSLVQSSENFYLYFTFIKRQQKSSLHITLVVRTTFVSYAPITQVCQVFHGLCARPQPFNFPSTGDSGKAYRGDAYNLSMYKNSREPVTITDVLRGKFQLEGSFWFLTQNSAFVFLIYLLKTF